MTFLDWVLGRYRVDFIPHWSAEKSAYYERATYRYLGIRPEPIYPWSRKYRPKAKLQSVDKVDQFKKRRSA